MTWFRRYRLGPLLGLVLLILILAVASRQFFTASNLLDIALQTSVNALLAIGMTFVILTAGIDLSVGSTLALTSAIAAQWMVGGTSPWLAGISALCIGAIAGAFNGVLVAYARLAPFIVTLGTMTLFRGLTEIYTNGQPIFNLPYSFNGLGNGAVLGVPVPVWITMIVFLIAWMVLSRTVAGRRIYAIGGNEKVAYLAGVRAKRYLVAVYVVSGILAALAGLILTSRLATAEPTAGQGYELDAITAVVLGGTSLFGGEGTLVGTIIGALILGVIDNGLNLLNVSSFYQDAVKGLVILIAIMLDRKRSEGR
ncbi:ABC transporter permease [Alicyclobacillus acidocaldarius]|uniref:Inner-membrane translocator n=1 Tax=Alicyclobacillus acidocaldarius subsp. acidocaldarius (strain ATCC 27009 / DSM 446 / BCRC 14685 / JCM 5260 / KCTC 1825 / NBRC 15652 / NCIMB 11725 / NRRL B-14509 / 104-IA) TaxID=521098 RepID=C8WRM6_ALIAD|nr:ribose ABC transporter permease [Alicyclobacillus acidocaldarius]ACV59287.1 inner-membrane translocator [Alicyclobacillus acidocaldarius subsp. acidocaldarius DSM 446]